MTATKNELVVTLPSDREILMTRVCDAPRDLVFDAMTRPEHLARWWGPRGLKRWYTAKSIYESVAPGNTSCGVA